MKLNVSSDEVYPFLIIRRPGDDYDHARSIEVPDDFSKAHDAEQALLRHLLAARLRPSSADIFSEHLDEE